MSRACSSIRKNQRSGNTALDPLPSLDDLATKRRDIVAIPAHSSLHVSYYADFHENIRLNLIIPSA